MNVQIDLLKEHPDNSWIYGDIDVTEMVEDIQKSNWIKTLVVNQDNVILSGHRRFMAAKILGYDSLDVEHVTTNNEIEMLERLLWENRNRVKTPSQMQRESVKWREIYSEQAKERQGTRTDIVDNCPQSNEPKTRDIVAAKVGFGSGMTLDRADKVAERIDELKESGKDREAKILETALNRSVSGALKFAEKDLSNVSDAVADKLKSGEVTVSTASSMAELPKEKQEDIVARGKDEILRMAKQIKADQAKKRVEMQRQLANNKKSKPLPDGEYDLIYCDPPWRYDFSETGSRQIENQYPTMDIEEIKCLKVPAADNCVLFMWSTAPKLKEAFEVIQAWGFTYKTQAVWDKEKIGMGYWFRGQHEILMVATKGSVSPPISSNRHPSVFREPRTKHSKKPEFYYEMIKEMFPDSKRIELFSRVDKEGFDNWGNET